MRVCKMAVLAAAAVAAGDLRIKSRVEKTMGMQEERPVWGGRVVLRRSHNCGAFLNFGEGKRGWIRAVSVCITAGITALYLHLGGQKRNPLLHFGASLLLGGAVSNTYDRLRRNYVVDYFSFRTGFKPLDRIVFNLADFAIMAGCMVMFFADAKDSAVYRDKGFMV